MPSQYKPADHEGRIRARWDASGKFHADPERVLRGEAEPFAMFIPPPNVTGALHLGHALNNTLQDILTRWHRMRGFETLWMPGTDHAGIATQAVVERRLRQEGELKGPLKDPERNGGWTRERFVAKVQAWKDEYEARITEQLKAMGCSCDFGRQRFTMDPICARAVYEAFFRFFRDGLIYRGKRLVNWDPVLQTAVADDECYDEEIDGNFYYLQYPLVTPVRLTSGDTIDHVTVATTRPETYLGDTAVAMNPGDPRAKALVGQKVRLPIVGRVISIIQDDYVVLPESMATTEEARNDPKAKFATGFLKVTPAHDANDHALWERHRAAFAGLPEDGRINILAPDATISDKHGWTDVGEAGIFLGLKREAARKRVVEEFKARGLCERVTPYRHSVPHSDRSKAIIEPYLSDQWYLKVTDPRMAASANAALAGEQRAAFSNSGGAGVPPAQERRGTTPPPLPVQEGLRVNVRRLPHFQAGGSTYFVTFRVNHGVLALEERQCVLDACFHWHGQRALVHAVTVMPDHVHMLLRPLEKSPGEWWSLGEIMHAIKSSTSHAIGKARGVGGTIWQDEWFDRIMRDGDETQEKWEYMQKNPVKAGLVVREGDYPFTQTWDQRNGGRDARPTSNNDRRDARPTSKEAAGDGSLRFHPARYAKTYELWHDNIRDWCISRQLWWGHRIPVWSKGEWTREEEAGFITLMDAPVQAGEAAWTGSTGVTRVCLRDPNDRSLSDLLEKLGFVRDPDVLDTWFSSALWPMSTLGWPDPEQSPQTKGMLEAFNPSSVLSTAREIITLWVSRMVMFNRYLRDEETERRRDEVGKRGGEAARQEEAEESARRADVPGHGPVPFRDVFIHAVVQDGDGKRMSKSAGNGVDPLDIIASHGADAMRFTLCQMTTQTQDVRMPVVKDAKSGRNTSPKFDLGRNVCNKLWNAARFALALMGERDEETQRRRDGVEGRQANSSTTSSLGHFVSPSPSSLSLPDRWMLSRLAAGVEAIDGHLARFEFSEYAQACYDLLWRDFCDWYLEAIKPTVQADAAQRAVLELALDTILRVLHPLAPFVTEAIWEQFGVRKGESLLCGAAWVRLDGLRRDEGAEAEFESIRSLVGAIREIRAGQQVKPSRKITLHVPPALQGRFGPHEALISALAGVGSFDPSAPRGASVAFAFESHECRVSDLADAVDASAERLRLERAAQDAEKTIATIQARLANPGYAQKAPPAMVQQSKDQLAKAEADRDAARAALAGLGPRGRSE